MQVRHTTGASCPILCSTLSAEGSIGEAISGPGPAGSVDESIQQVSGANLFSSAGTEEVTVFAYTTGTTTRSPSIITTYTTISGNPTPIIVTIDEVTETVTDYTTQTLSTITTVTGSGGDGLGPKIRSTYYGNSSDVPSSSVAPFPYMSASSSAVSPATALPTAPADTSGLLLVTGLMDDQGQPLCVIGYH